MPGAELPPYAHVPGQTPRHPEGAFDALKAGLAPGAGAAALACAPALAAGLRFLDHGYFWEAHEVLEAVWLAARPNSAERAAVAALIQAANAGLKLRIGRPGAARRLAALAEGHLAEALRGGPVLGLEPEELKRRVNLPGGVAIPDSAI